MLRGVQRLLTSLRSSQLWPAVWKWRRLWPACSCFPPRSPMCCSESAPFLHHALHCGPWWWSKKHKTHSSVHFCGGKEKKNEEEEKKWCCVKHRQRACVRISWKGMQRSEDCSPLIWRKISRDWNELTNRFRAPFTAIKPPSICACLSLSFGWSQTWNDRKKGKLCLRDEGQWASVHAVGQA